MTYSIREEWKYTYGFLLLISVMSGAIIPIIYAISPKCRHHPASITLIICLLEMIACYQIFLDAICLKELIQFLNQYIDYNTLVKFYTFGELKIYSLTQLTQAVCYFNQNTILICVIAQLNYYCILTVDLIITLKKPFMNTQARLRFYHFTAITCTAVLFAISTKNADSKCSSIDCDDKVYDVQSNMYYQTGVLFFLIIICSYMAIQDLRKCKKLSETVRKNRMILYENHLILVITLLVLWATPAISKIMSEEFKTNIIGRIYFAIMLSHPSILLFIRLREPYFKYGAKQFLLNLLKFKFYIDDDEDDGDDQQWIMPLGQLVQNQQNQETVGNILSSILDIVDYKAEFVPQRSKYIRHKTDIDSIAIPLLEDHDKEQLQVSFDYQIIEYYPGLFQTLRQMDSIDYSRFYESLRLDKNDSQIRKTQESLGRSGSFFFFSYDKKLIIKTITSSEIELLRNMLSNYANYIKQHSHSLIARFYGLFTVNIEGFSKIHLVLMENILELMPNEIKQYDLKGSLVNRKQKVAANQVDDVFYSRFSYKPSNQVLKDVNLIQSTDLFIELSKADRNKLFLQLKLDTEFLQQHQIMDYSMLLGVSNEKIKGENFRTFKNKKKSYAFGIIDYTQQFTCRKKLEQMYKTLMRRSGSQISCVNPEFYCQRFYSFLNSVIIINNNA